MADTEQDKPNNQSGQSLSREFAARLKRTLPQAKGSVGAAPKPQDESSVFVDKPLTGVPQRRALEPEVNPSLREEPFHNNLSFTPTHAPQEVAHNIDDNTELDDNEDFLENEDLHDTFLSKQEPAFLGQRSDVGPINSVAASPQVTPSNSQLSAGFVHSPKKTPVVTPDKLQNKDGVTFKLAQESPSQAAKKLNQAHGATPAGTKPGASGNIKGQVAQKALGEAAALAQAEAQELIDAFADSAAAKGVLTAIYVPWFLGSIVTFGIMLPVLNAYTFAHSKFGFFLRWAVRLLETALKDFLAATGVGAAVTVSVDAIEAALGQDLGSILGTIIKRAKMPVVLKVLTLILDLLFALFFGMIIYVVMWYICGGVTGKIATTVNSGVEFFTGNNTYGDVCRIYNQAVAGVNFDAAGSRGNIGNGGNNGGPINIGKWKDLVNKYAGQYGLDPCVLNTVLEMESSGGNPNAVGHDNHSRSNDPEQLGNAPNHGLNFGPKNWSHGIGMTQITIFPEGSRQGGANWPNFPVENGVKVPARWASTIPEPNPVKKYYTISDLLDPDTSVRLAAVKMSGAMKSSGGNLWQAFKNYNGGASYADKAMKKYEQCKTTAK